LKSRITTMLLVLGLVVFGAGGAYAASAQLGLAKGHHGKKHAKHHAKKHHGHNGTSVTQPTTTTNGDNAAQNQYGTRPGKGCGDRNHVHTGPPGNPSNTSCPPESQHSGTAPKTSAKTLGSHHTRHHTRKKHGKKNHQ
jgi:hypothetical protein